MTRRRSPRRRRRPGSRCLASRKSPARARAPRGTPPPVPDRAGRGGARTGAPWPVPLDERLGPGDVLPCTRSRRPCRRPRAGRWPGVADARRKRDQGRHALQAVRRRNIDADAAAAARVADAAERRTPRARAAALIPAEVALGRSSRAQKSVQGRAGLPLLRFLEGIARRELGESARTGARRAAARRAGARSRRHLPGDIARVHALEGGGAPGRRRGRPSSRRVQALSCRKSCCSARACATAAAVPGGAGWTVWSGSARRRRRGRSCVIDAPPKEAGAMPGGEGGGEPVQQRLARAAAARTCL